jgi:hypothetical protein
MIFIVNQQFAADNPRHRFGARPGRVVRRRGKRLSVHPLALVSPDAVEREAERHGGAAPEPTASRPRPPDANDAVAKKGTETGG